MDKLPAAPRNQKLATLGQVLPERAVTSTYSTAGEHTHEANPILAFRKFLRRWKWTLIVSTLLGTLIGIAVTILQPTLYQAKASLEIQDLNDAFLNVKQFLPVNESDGPANTYGDIQTQIKLLQSDSFLTSVAKRMPALEAPVLSTLRPVSAWPGRPFVSGQSGDDYLQRETIRLTKNFKVRAVGQTRIIELTAESSNPRLAADFLDAVCAAYIEENIKARYEMGQHTSASLSRLLDAERIQLRQSEDALQSYARSSGLLFTGANKSVAEQKLSELQDELSKAEEDRIGAQSRYETAKQSSVSALPDTLTQGSVRDYQSKVIQLRQQLADLAVTYTSDYYKVKRLEAQIAALESAVGEEQRIALEQAESQYREATQREKLLGSSYKNQAAVVSDLAKRSIQYNILEREVEANRQSYDEMLKQVKEATVASAIRTDNVRVVDEAVPPKVAHSPQPKVNCALGFLLGSSFGLLLALIRERVDLSLREPGEAIQHLGLAELGAVVHVGRSEIRSRQLIALGQNSHGKSYPVLESYRAVATSLLSEAIAGNYRVLVVTSPGPGEGKTTVTANLGLMLAAIGRRVLIIDGDLRKPRLDKVFDLSNDHGLSTFLAPDRSTSERDSDLVQRVSGAGLSVLTSGPPLPDVAHLLYSAKFRYWLGTLDKEYDFVLIDTPPVLPMADARIIGALADGVIFLVRAGQTARDAAEAALQRLEGDGIHVVGLILNDWDPAASVYKYYAKYARVCREIA